MARHRRATFESSSSSESDSDSGFSSASSHKTSPVEKSALSTKPLNGGNYKPVSSGNDNDNKMKSLKRLRSQKRDNEEPSYPEHTQNPGAIHLGGVQQVITAIRATDLTLGHNTGHACRGQLLGNQSVMLFTRFERRGNDEDLDQAIAFQREMLALHPIGHTDQSKCLNNLANQLSTRFDHRGNDEDLDPAIALHREAPTLRPVGHTDRSTSLKNLAVQLSTRFSHRGNDEDLDQAIALHREALTLSLRCRRPTLPRVGSDSYIK